MPSGTPLAPLPGVLHVVAQHPYLALFATAFVSQAALFVPVVPFLISAGALAAHHQVQLAPAIAALAVGVAPADFIWYTLGRRVGGRLLARVCRISLEPDNCVRDTQRVFSRYGARVFVVAKCIPGLSTVAMPLAGVLRMRARRFLAFDAAGAVLWTAAYVVLGDLGATRLIALTGRSHPRTLITIALVSTVAYLLWRVAQRRQFVRTFATSRIDPDDLRRKLEAGDDVLVLDLRHAIDVEADPHVIPGALQIPAEDLRHRVRDIPRDREIVLYCT